MTKEEELQALREENRVLRALVAELLPLKEQLAQAHARIKELEDRLAKDSRTSSKPPSSDGQTRLLRSARRPSGKRPGGQAGHPGHTLSLVEQPDEVVRHRPKVCSQCREGLSAVPGSVAERRQVLDMPEIRLLAQEHQLEAICCPTCHTTSLGSFPASVSAPVQYGPNLQALAVYLHQGQLLPTARTCEALAAICGCQLSEATLLQWSELPAERLAPTVERNEWVARYFEILAAGSAAQPPPPASSAGSRKGRRKQSKAKNLLDALLLRAEQVLALLDDLRIPFTNNQAERDLRWAKVQQKISGTFRSVTGVTAFCHIRRYLSTMQKQGHSMLSALTAVFHGQPLPVAWGPE